ncbi:hypothetical protein ABT364_10615 [Massilia sp. SR12]
MTDQQKASTLAGEAFDHWQAGRHEQSRQVYEEAISLADPEHYGLSGYYGEYACVLNALGCHEQAATQLEKALAADLAQGQPEGSPAIIVARYLLASQLLQLGANEDALEVLAPSISHAPGDWLTRLAEARILYALDRKVEAIAAAQLAVAGATNPEKAQQLRQDLERVLAATDSLQS